MLESVETQVDKKINFLIKNLYSKSVAVKKEAEDLLEHNCWHSNIDKLCFVLGGYYYSKKEYYVSKLYYEKSLKYSIGYNHINFFRVSLLFLLRINYYLNSNECNFILYKKYYHLHLSNSYELEAMITYNFGLTFQCLNKYELALKLYEKVPKYTNREFLLSTSKINRGICLQEIKEYDISIEIFREIIFITSNPLIKLKAYCNIISCSRKNNDPILCQITINKLEKLIVSFNKDQLYQVYFTLGLGHLFLNNIEKSIVYFEREVHLGIDVGNNNFNLHKYLESIKYLLILYTKKELSKILNLKNIILSIPSFLLNLEFILFIIKRYDELFLRNETTEILNKLYKKIKEI